MKTLVILLGLSSFMALKIKQATNPHVKAVKNSATLNVLGSATTLSVPLFAIQYANLRFATLAAKSRRTLFVTLNAKSLTARYTRK